MDLGICRGGFYLPGYPPGPRALADAIAARWSNIKGIGIETLDGDAVDPFVVGIDAAFRAAWTAMNCSIPRTRPEGFAMLRAQFVDACGSAGEDRLTAARYLALRDFVALFDQAERRPVAVSECLEGVRRTISAAARFNRFVGLSPAGLHPPLTASEEAALASLA